MRTVDAGLAKARDVLGDEHDPERLIGVPLDLLDPSSIEKAGAMILEAVGAPDGVVHNAGVAGVGCVEEMPLSVVEEMLATNLIGPIRLTRELLPAMRAAGQGRIVVVSSESGLRGMPGISSYGASKGALERWSESLAGEIAPFGLGVTVLVTGTFKTDILEQTHNWKDPEGPYARLHEQLESKQDLVLRLAPSPDSFAPSVERALRRTQGVRTPRSRARRQGDALRRQGHARTIDGLDRHASARAAPPRISPTHAHQPSCGHSARRGQPACALRALRNERSHRDGRTTTRTGLARRERRGSEKQAIGIENIQRMLPLVIKTMTEGEPSPRDTALMGFAPDMMPMMMEDAYCDTWGRTDVIDNRVRSLFTVSLMIGVGNVGNEFELDYHAPGAIYNGATVRRARGHRRSRRRLRRLPGCGPCMNAIVDALLSHELLDEPSPPARPRTPRAQGKREASEGAGNALAHATRLTAAPRQRRRCAGGVFAAELDLMMLENIYYDLWTRTDVLDPKTRSVVTLGLIMGLGNLDALGEHVPMAVHNGVSVPELEEFVYHAATYVGYISATSLRKAIAEAL